MTNVFPGHGLDLLRAEGTRTPNLLIRSQMPSRHESTPKTLIQRAALQPFVRSEGNSFAATASLNPSLYWIGFVGARLVSNIRAPSEHHGGGSITHAARLDRSKPGQLYGTAVAPQGPSS